MKSVCVFCGSNLGSRPEYARAVRELATALVQEGIVIVYGGARVGAMGLLADAALEAGGGVIGVMPEFLVDAEIAHTGLTSMHVVGSMHERKAMMAELSDGFVALPGGLGTLEEVAEILTWSQLGLHAKPVGFLNVAGYYDLLLAFLDHGVTEGFLRAENRQLVLSAASATELLGLLRAWTPPAAAVRKWIDNPANPAATPGSLG
ncbi:MAG: TIGR00730 family Rossman fold protein [Acidimicrobiales bacterium]